MKIAITLLLIYFLMPFAVLAKTVTATGDTLDDAENNIRQQTRKEGGKSYKIIEAQIKNKVHMTAEIIP